MIRIGLLGAAKISPQAIIAPALKRDDCEIVAMACRDTARGETYAKEHGVPEVIEGYETLLARADIDLIYNALPPSRHADLTVAALEAGKAVLCEKPFAMNAAEAERMVAAAAATGRPLVEAFHYRFHPAFQRAFDIVRAGRLGTIGRVEAAFNVAIPYQKGEIRHTLAVGGGALMDLGCYPVHWARTMIGTEPEIVSAKAHCEHDGVDLMMQAEMRFSGGETASVATSMEPDQEFKAWMTVEGDAGRLEMLNPLAPHMGHKITTVIDGDTRSFTEQGDTTYDYQLAHMIAVMKDGATQLTGGKDAIGNMRAIDAIYSVAGLKPRGT